MVFSYDFSSDGLNDGISRILSDYCNSDNNVQVIINTCNQNKVKTVNLADARNRILYYIRKDYNSYDFLVMMDANDINDETINTEILKKYLNRND